MSKGTIKTIKVSGILLLVGIILLVIGGIFGGESSISFEKDFSEADKIVEEDLGDYKNLNVDFYNGILEIKKSDVDKIIIYGNKEKNTAEYYIENDTLYIKENSSSLKDLNFISLNFNSILKKKVILYTTSEYLEDVEVKFANGECNIEGINAAEFDTTAKTCDLMMNDISVKNMKLELSLGEQNLKNIKGQNIDITSKAGELTAENFESKDVRFDIAQGRFNIKNLIAEEMHLNAKQGEVEMHEINVDILKTKSSMGDFTIKGKINKEAKIYGKMGQLNLKLDGNRDEYDVTEIAKLGSIICTSNDKDTKDNEDIKKIRVEMSMGDAIIMFADEEYKETEENTTIELVEDQEDENEEEDEE